MRSSDGGDGEGKAVDLPPSSIATITGAVNEGEGEGKAVDEGEGKAVDGGEGEGKAVDMTVFL